MMEKIIIRLVFVSSLAGCASLQPPIAPDSRNRVVDIVNTTGNSVIFHAKNAERRGAFRERFAVQEVPAEYYATVNFDNGSGACMFDMFAIFPDGREAVQSRFDTCTEVSWVINAEGIQ